MFFLIHPFLSFFPSLHPPFLPFHAVRKSRPSSNEGLLSDDGRPGHSQTQSMSRPRATTSPTNDILIDREPRKTLSRNGPACVAKVLRLQDFSRALPCLGPRHSSVVFPLTIVPSHHGCIRSQKKTKSFSSCRIQIHCLA